VKKQFAVFEITIQTVLLNLHCTECWLRWTHMKQKSKMASLQQKTVCMYCGSGRWTLWRRCDDITAWNMEGNPRTVVYWGGGSNPPSKFQRPSKIMPNSTRLWKLLKIAEFRVPTPQDVWKKGSKILELPRSAAVLH